jgi:vancomycin resistance protein YoaR
MKIIKKFILKLFPIFLFFIPLHAEPVIIASFAASVEDQDADVKHNITLACNRLNGYVIQPSAIFSFNEIIGEGNAKAGYKNGRVFYKDEVVYEPGGGLCEVSSTVFNAMLMAGFNITERHRHIKPVGYVPIGLDATIKYGKKDLRMKNPYKQPVVVRASMNDKNIVIALEGEPIGYSYNIRTEEEEVEIPLTENNPNIRNGINVYVYRLKYSGDNLLENFLLYKDYYPAAYKK